MWPRACLCLARYVSTTWPQKRQPTSFRVSSAIVFDEALSGANQNWPRYAASIAGWPASGLVLDPGDRLGPFAGTNSWRWADRICARDSRSAMVIPSMMKARSGFTPRRLATASSFWSNARQFAGSSCGGAAPGDPAAIPLWLITCLDRAVLAALRPRISRSVARDCASYLSCFDESFVDHPGSVSPPSRPVGSLFDLWNAPPGKNHLSTRPPSSQTPSPVSFRPPVSRKPGSAVFMPSIAPELERAQTDLAFRRVVFRKMYSPSLLQAPPVPPASTCPASAQPGILSAPTEERSSMGSAGVACSVRGHNPGRLRHRGGGTERTRQHVGPEVTDRLRELTGLDHVLPGGERGGGR